MFQKEKKKNVQFVSQSIKMMKLYDNWSVIIFFIQNVLILGWFKMQLVQYVKKNLIKI